MSDENVGGLVEKWRMSSVVNMATASIEEIKRATTLTCCANELEAALSAHGQPVVDAVLLADLKRCMDDVATEMRARGRSDSRFVQLSARIAALTGADHE